MRFSQKGAKDNRIKLVWSKYFNYKLEGTDYYFKQKAYTTHHDGWTEHEKITKQTYKNAIKRGNECKEVIVEEDIMAASLNCLALIFSEEHEVCEVDTRGHILETKKVIKDIKENCELSKGAEYKLFKRMLKIHIDIDQEDIAI